MLLVAFLVSGCASRAIDRAPPAPHLPWLGSPELRPDTDQTARAGFGIPAVPLPALSPATVVIDPDEPLGLVRLIDLAQRENAQTRQSWNRAREAALSVGMVEATFLPILSANVLTGQQRVGTPSPLPFGSDTIHARISGTVPALTLSWLLFDFGKRHALLEGAEQLSFAANVIFNATHQKVIRDVTDHYYQYDAALVRVRVAREMLEMNGRVARAAQARLRSGIGTTVELAVARQAVAQAKLHLVNSEGIERNVYLALLDAVGLLPTTRLTIAEPEAHPLPASAAPMTEQLLQQALSRRPDVAATYAAMRAAEAGVRAAEAEFMPKIYLGAAYSKRHSSFNVQGLPGLNQQSTGNGVLLGITMPLYDGGLRRTALSQAQIRLDEATQALQTSQRVALREMVAAQTGLQSALQSHETAQELVDTAQVAYDGALAAYQAGMGTITMATEAANQVLQARQARLDARSASLVAAANLAFATGSMIHAQNHWLPEATTSGTPARDQ
jgi:outer membrane protein